MRFKANICQVFTREFEAVLARTSHSVDVENVPMGLHDLGVEMRGHLQERIDAADASGYDAILLGYALCGRGTEGLRAGKTQLVLPRAHDCITLFFGSRGAYQNYFDEHPGTYYMTTGWVERNNFQEGQYANPAYGKQGVMGKLGLTESYEQMVAKYGQENADFIRPGRQTYSYCG